MERVAEPEEEPDPLSLGQPDPEPRAALLLTHHLCHSGSIRIHSVTAAFLGLSETPFALS